jgi:hypothetical protein
MNPIPQPAARLLLAYAECSEAYDAIWPGGGEEAVERFDALCAEHGYSGDKYGRYPWVRELRSRAIAAARYGATQ